MQSAALQRSTPALVVCVDALVLIALRGAPARALATLNTLGHSSTAADADRIAAALCSAGLFLVALWLGLGLAVTATAAVPGATGRVAGRASRLLLPAVLRRVLAGTAGLGVLFAPVAAVAATPAAHPITHYDSTVADATPTPTAPNPTAPNSSAPNPAAQIPAAATPTWPTTTGRTVKPPTALPTPDALARAHVRVGAGDSLWLIAAHRLGTRAADADIAQYWPRVFARNRDIVGDDPDLIKPGQRLTLPDPTAEELRS